MVSVDNNKIRVENLPDVEVSRYSDSEVYCRNHVRDFTVLFLNCYQPAPSLTYAPSMGIIMLIAALRKHFGDKINIHFVDMRVNHIPPEESPRYFHDYNPDVIAVSALNCEARTAYKIAGEAKAWNPRALTVLGGPVVLHRPETIFNESDYDWAFSGAADRTFPAALERYFSALSLAKDLPGFSYRTKKDERTYNTRQDLLEDLDSLPLPAWDMVDLDAYNHPGRPRMTQRYSNRKYGTLFTSRGCPYLCNYCHDIFTKKFVYNSAERVLEEIRILYETKGVTEFHVMDDIFNLHKPRVKEIMRKARERWNGEIRFAFVGGLRGDILDQETIDSMVDGGAFYASIAIETVTPRLQELVEKHLDIEKTFWSINEFERQGVTIATNFMLGFPTEKISEIKQSIRRAVRSKTTLAYFFPVMPQPSTPIHDLAMKESPEATRYMEIDERDNGHYFGHGTWYQYAYGYPLRSTIAMAHFKFYFYPPRFFKILKTFPASSLVRALPYLLHQGFVSGVYGFVLWCKDVVVKNLVNRKAAKNVSI